MLFPRLRLRRASVRVTQVGVPEASSRGQCSLADDHVVTHRQGRETFFFFLSFHKLILRKSPPYLTLQAARDASQARRGEGVVAAQRLGSGAGGAGTPLACPLLVCPEPSWPARALRAGGSLCRCPLGREGAMSSLFP